jgi:hypothetical protein
MPDSASIVQRLQPDSVQWKIIPNTYNMYWETDAKELAERLLSESADWWNRKRVDRAWELGLSQKQVVTLASIVQEETANKGRGEKSRGTLPQSFESRNASPSRPHLEICSRRLDNSTIARQRQKNEFTLQYLSESGTPPRGPFEFQIRTTSKQCSMPSRTITCTCVRNLTAQAPMRLLATTANI